MAPRIAIPVPTSTDTAYNNLNWPAYADAVLACGGDPVRVELGASPRELTDLSYSCQAILLPGSPADVNPAKYGQVRVEQTAYTDLPRENVDELLLQDAHNLFKPIFGVCFGMQMLNVWRSGTLVQDLAPLPVNHSAARGVAVAHTVAVAQGTLLADLMLAIDPTAPLRSLPVNSSHHQGCRHSWRWPDCGARSNPDGVVESIEGGQAVSYLHPSPATAHIPRHFVLGVQWHPERDFSQNSFSRSLFTGFLETARTWTPRSVDVSVVPG